MDSFGAVLLYQRTVAINHLWHEVPLGNSFFVSQSWVRFSYEN